MIGNFLLLTKLEEVSPKWIGEKMATGYWRRINPVPGANPFVVNKKAIKGKKFIDKVLTNDKLKHPTFSGGPLSNAFHIRSARLTGDHKTADGLQKLADLQSGMERVAKNLPEMNSLNAKLKNMQDRILHAPIHVDFKNKKPQKIKESALLEVSQEYLIHKLMTSKKKFGPKGVARGLALLERNQRNIAKRKGLKAAMAKNIDAVIHATRHPKVKAVVDVVNMTEPHYQGLPLHPGRW